MTEKTFLVTGVSRGIGQAICIELLNSGYTVHGTYNTGESEAKELTDKYENLTVHKADFAQKEHIVALLEQLKDIEFDGIVNNAGVFKMEDFDEYDFAIWEEIFQINLNAPLQIVMGLKNKIKPGGAVVNVSNLGKKNIRVNAIAPGWINTGMSTPESMEAVKIAPLGRNGKPEEVADLVHYLLSSKSSFITGETIVIDGGYGNVDYIMLQEALNN